MAKITINQQRCKGCLLCISFCPKGVIKKGQKINQKGFVAVEIDPQADCAGCTLCALICPDSCIEVYK